MLCPQISRRKLLWIATKLQNLWVFSLESFPLYGSVLCAWRYCFRLELWKLYFLFMWDKLIDCFNLQNILVQYWYGGGQAWSCSTKLWLTEMTGGRGTVHPTTEHSRSILIWWWTGLIMQHQVVTHRDDWGQRHSSSYNRTFSFSIDMVVDRLDHAAPSCDSQRWLGAEAQFILPGQCQKHKSWVFKLVGASQCWEKQDSSWGGYARSQVA